jgi:hypothetical protein
MKVLIAAVAEDSTTVPGELVNEGLQCDNPHCDCGEGFMGIASKGYTLLATVVDRDEITSETMTEILAGWFRSSRWAEAAEMAQDAVADLVEQIERFPVGATVRRVDGELEWA